MKVQGLIAARREELQQLQQEIADLRGNLQYDEASQTDLQSQLTHLLQEIQSRESMHSKKVRNHRAIIEKRREKILEIDQEIVEQDMLRDQIQGQVHQSGTAVGELLTKLSLIKTPLGLEENLQRQIQHEEEKRADQEAFLRDAELRKHQLSKRIMLLREEIVHVRDMSETVLNSELEMQDSRMAGLQQSVERWERQRAALKAETASQQEQTGSERDGVNKAEFERRKLEQDLRWQRAEIERLEAESVSIRARKERLESERRALEEQRLEQRRQAGKAAAEEERLRGCISEVGEC